MNKLLGSLKCNSMPSPTSTGDIYPETGLSDHVLDPLSLSQFSRAKRSNTFFLGRIWMKRHNMAMGTSLRELQTQTIRVIRQRRGHCDD
ncbi:hypothetical protein E4U40_007468 [Claviceps sp. LM458 group G5]|nr:hypothetical protein E4U40_007468 [Claviceps sp. LM458 group G5]